MKRVMLRLIVLFMSFGFGVGLNTYYLDYVHPLFNAYYLGSVHPLSFELVSALNACKLTIEKYNTSDGKKVSLMIKELESATVVEQEIQKLLAQDHYVLEREQILNPKTKQLELKIITIFNQKDKKATDLSIIMTDGDSITILYVPTLWHAQEFEYFLSKN